MIEHKLNEWVSAKAEFYHALSILGRHVAEITKVRSRLEHFNHICLVHDLLTKDWKTVGFSRSIYIYLELPLFVLLYTRCRITRFCTSPWHHAYSTVPCTASRRHVHMYMGAMSRNTRPSTPTWTYIGPAFHVCTPQETCGLSFNS